MKKALMLLALIAFVSTGAAAADKVGLYADLSHSVMEETGLAMFDVYLWHQPDVTWGNMSTELLITFPATLACTGKAYCADMTLTKDDITAPATGGSIAWANCTYDWKWSAKMTFIDTGFYSGSPTVGYIQVADHPISHGIWIADCTEDYLIHPATPLNWFGLNQDGVIGTAESTWGAIKDLQ